MGNLERLGLYLLCSIALLFSLFKLGEQSLWIDEGYSINAAQAIQQKLLPILDSDRMYVKGVLSTYVMAISMSIFGFDPNNPWSARIPSVLFWVATIILTFHFSKKIFQRDAIALLASGIMTFLSWEIAWSRQARGYTGMQFFCLASFLFLYKWLKDRNYLYLNLSILFLFISILFHPSSSILILPMVGVIFYDALRKQSRDVLSAIYASVLIVCTAIFFYRILPLQFELKYTAAYFIAVKDNMFGIAILATISLFFVFIDERNRRKIFFLVLSILIPVLFLSIYRYSVQQRYVFALIPFFAVLAAYSAFKFNELIFKQSEKFIVLGSMILIFGVGFNGFLFFPQTFFHVETRSPQPNFKQAYSIIDRTFVKGNIIISPYTHLSKIYLGDRGYWLPISLTSNKDEISRNTINNADYYTGAPKINSIDELILLLSTNSGFVVFDKLAWVRLGKSTVDTMLSFDPELVYHSGIDLDEMWVYKF